MTGLYDLYLQVIAYAIIVFGSFFIYNFLSKGFLFTYMRVKASRGKNILVRVFTRVGLYYAVGKVSDDVLQYKKRNSKNKGTVDLDKAQILDEMGVKIVEIEEITGKVIGKNWDAVQGQNIDKFDQINVRCLEGPKLVDKTKEALKLLLQIATLIGVAFCAFMLFNLSNTINAAGGGTGVI